jgi:hypothetical protein
VQRLGPETAVVWTAGKARIKSQESLFTVSGRARSTELARQFLATDALSKKKVQIKLQRTKNEARIVELRKQIEATKTRLEKGKD